MANKLPGLNKWDRERLTNSIKDIGIQIPVVFDQYGNIIDGHHRKEIADILGVEYPCQVILVQDDSHFEKLAIELNLARRQMSFEQINDWMIARKKIALDARLNGATQKEAAEQVGVARQTLQGWEDKLFSIAEAGNAEQPPDNRVKLDKSLYSEIWERKQNGEKTEELASQYGVSKATISSACSQVTKEKNKQAEIEKRKDEVKAVIENPEASIIHGDFKEIDIPDNSVDLILTDPPYGIDFEDTWTALGEFAKRVLKPSRFLVTYFGQLNLAKFYEALNKNLDYYWTFCLTHSGNNQLITPRNVFCGWKPILVFQKPPFKILDKPMDDVIRGSGREKDGHEWQQGLAELDELIEKFTIEKETIIDPFCGSGTTIVAALSKNRKGIGIEISDKYWDIANARINGYQNRAT